MLFFSGFWRNSRTLSRSVDPSGGSIGECMKPFARLIWKVSVYVRNEGVPLPGSMNWLRGVLFVYLYFVQCCLLM